MSYRPAELRSHLATGAGDAGRGLGPRRRMAALGQRARWSWTSRCRRWPTRGGRCSAPRSCSTTSPGSGGCRTSSRATNRQLETAYEELQSTNEELETTNEELQSTVEELETTNEELQSTNEELETMNEELQSMNDELQATNDELRSVPARSRR